MKHLRNIIMMLIFGLGGFISLADNAKAAEVAAPVIISHTGGSVESDTDQATFFGRTGANQEVLIYVDDRFSGMAVTEKTGTGTANFAYTHPMPLSIGRHKAIAVARNLGSLILSPPSAEYFFSVSQRVLPAPTIVAPGPGIITSQKPHLAGLTVSGTLIKVYIDGVYNGRTDLNFHPSGTASFSYRPFLSLSRGKHEIKFVAVNEAGRQSAAKIVNINIEYPMPAPTMVKAVVNQSTTAKKPFIAGLAKNNSRIHLYVNGRLDGSFTVKNHESGTANFAYRPKNDLKRGNHTAYALASDSRGKVSQKSNVIRFKVRDPQIATAAYEIGTGTKRDNQSKPAQNNAQSAPTQSKTDTAEIKATSTASQTPSAPSELKKAESDLLKILEGSTSTASTTGAMDENESAQGKIKMNVVIFILFLLGVIGWIIWVNRELVKEKRGDSGNDKISQN